MKRHLIVQVEEYSIASELDIVPGDKLISINKQEIKDIFDYHYLVNDEQLLILIEKENGEEWELEIEKDADEDLGISFDQSLMDEYKSCFNKCIFCFIDQNPKGMRDTIYFKDDDTRLSFLQGNYVTLTNMKDEDIKRIIDYKLAPINISVHTTNMELRCNMLHNRFADNLMRYIDMLYEAGIPMNAQVVLCKNYNDKAELEKTISDLLEYAPVIESLSIVPVGLSKYRDGLCQLEPFDSEDAREVIGIVEKYQKTAYEKHGIHFVHASDEWYLNANLPIPNGDNYDGYIQLENGVGMVRLLYDEVNEAVEYYLEENNNIPCSKKRKVTIVTGVLAYDTMCEVSQIINKVAPDIEINVNRTVNNFFGERITVTGLLTGQDIIAGLEGKNPGDAVLISCNCLKADEDIFLDDMSVEELQNALQVPVIIVESSGMSLFEAVLG